jgi:hypothetical protein
MTESERSERSRQVGAIFDEFSPEEKPVLYGYLRVRMARHDPRWAGSAVGVRGDGSMGMLDMGFELERYDADLQQRI